MVNHAPDALLTGRLQLRTPCCCRPFRQGVHTHSAWQRLRALSPLIRRHLLRARLRSPDRLPLALHQVTLGFARESSTYLLAIPGVWSSVRFEQGPHLRSHPGRVPRPSPGSASCATCY